MNTTEIEHLKYPIGKRNYAGSLSDIELAADIKTVEELPNRLRTEVSHLSQDQLDTPYREGGWTVRQVVHHLGDSHMNAFIRCKLLLTEQEPTIKAYNEAAWAEKEDCINMPIAPGLNLLEALHQRWVVLLKSVSQVDLQRTYLHPQYGKVFTLLEAINLYAWHSRHHLAHITELKNRNSWT